MDKTKRIKDGEKLQKQTISALTFTLLLRGLGKSRTSGTAPVATSFTPLQPPLKSQSPQEHATLPNATALATACHNKQTIARNAAEQTFSFGNKHFCARTI